MKKSLFSAAQFALFSLFVLSLLFTLFRLLGKANPLTKFDHEDAVYNRIEAYDPSLGRLNSLKKVEQYCDSVYAAQTAPNLTGDYQKTYTDIVSNTIRNRFYHGYSYYSLSNNYVATIVSKVTIPGLSALVIPDEILKYPYAACSQQCIVMMEVLKSKGIDTRKVGFVGTKCGGHFAFEAYYAGSWHFHDPNMEPDKNVLAAYDRPSIEFLVKNPDVLTKAYGRYPKEQIMDIFPTYFYGPVNKFPAPKAIVFQKATGFLSYTAWAFFLVGFLFARYRYKKVKYRIHTFDAIPIRKLHPVSTAI